MLLVLSLKPAPSQFPLPAMAQRCALRCVVQVACNGTYCWPGGAIALISHEGRGEVGHDAWACDLHSSTLGNSVRDRRPAVSKDRAAVLLDI
jgi:hypothetical protein